LLLPSPKARDFGKARIANLLTDMWTENTLDLPSCPYERTAPSLTAEELASIPGAEIATGKLELLRLQSCCRVNDKIVIKEDAKREWTSVDDDFHAQFTVLSVEHDKMYASALTQLLGGNSTKTSEASPGLLAIKDGVVDDAGTSDACEEMESIEALRAKYDAQGVQICSSDFNGVKHIFVKDEAVWLLADEDTIIPPRSLIGSFGGGSYVPKTEGVAGLPYDFPDGDRTLVHFEGMDGQSPIVCTFYSMLRAAEDKGIIKYKVANVEVTRAENAGNTDKILIKKTEPLKLYKFSADTKQIDDKLYYRDIKLEHIQAKTSKLIPVTRFRFEKVGRNFKPMKCYVASVCAITLKAGRPKKVV